jgi:hypothetical protein
MSSLKREAFTTTTGCSTLMGSSYAYRKCEHGSQRRKTDNITKAGIKGQKEPSLIGSRIVTILGELRDLLKIEGVPFHSE